MIHIKVVNGHFCTVLQYVPPVEHDHVWWFRKPRDLYAYSGMNPNNENSIYDYITTRADAATT